MKKLLSVILIPILFNNSINNEYTINTMKAAEEFLVKQISKNNTPGLQYYFFDEESIIFNYSGGYSDILKQEKVTDETTFNAYSVTKTFTALAILQLEEKGLIDIDNKFIQYLPNFPYGSDITIRQVMSHSSGIPNPFPLKWVHDQAKHKSFDRDGFFKQIFRKNIKTKFSPDEKMSYSNLGYVLLGQLIEKISGLSYEDYIRENILDPLQINKNELDFDINNIDRHAKGYIKRFSFSNLVLGLLIDQSRFTDKTEGKWKSYKNKYVNGAPYGGLIGSGNGFVTYLQELLKPGNKLISDVSKKKLFKENFLKNGKSSNMCLSWFKGEFNGQTYYAHAGGGFYYCEIRLYPESGKGSVIMFNRSGMSDKRFLDKVDKYFINNN